MVGKWYLRASEEPRLSFEGVGSDAPASGARPGCPHAGMCIIRQAGAICAAARGHLQM